MLAVGIVEERRIRQAWANDLFIAGDHLIRVLALDVRDSDEQRLQLALIIQQVEVFLIGLHRGNQALGRYFQEALVEAAGERHGPLHQTAHLYQQVLVDDGVGFLDFGLGEHLLTNTLAALLTVGQHVGVFQCCQVIVGVLELDGIRCVEAVAVGGAAGLKAKGFGGNHLVAIQRHQPVNRAGELSARCAPAHVFWYGQRL